MLVRCQRFGDWFLFGLVWQYSSIQKNIIKVGAKSWMFTCSYHITLSLPFYTDPDSKREINFCNGYLSLLYFWPDRSRDWQPFIFIAILYRWFNFYPIKFNSTNETYSRPLCCWTVAKKIELFYRAVTLLFGEFLMLW